MLHEAEQALYVADRPPPCTVDSVRTPATADTSIVLVETDYPCRLYFRETGVALRSDSAGRWPDPGRHVARNSRGQFLSSVAGDNSRLATWNPDGSFADTFGSPGLGPGELPRSSIEPVVYVDGSDWIYVRSGGHLWTVFTPHHEFVGRVTAPGTGRVETNTVFAPRRILVSNRGEARRPYFTIRDVNGAVTAEFPEPTSSRAPPNPTVRRVIPADDSSFWAGPDHSRGGGYSLELWSISGRLLARIVRDVSWFSDPPGRRPTMGPLNVDPNGHLLIYAWVHNGAPDDTLDPGADMDIHLEVIDWRGRRVLASEVVSGRALVQRAIPATYFPRTNLGYRIDESSGLPVVRVVEYGLMPR